MDESVVLVTTVEQNLYKYAYRIIMREITKN